MAKRTPRRISFAHVANVVDTIQEATEAERYAGMHWYRLHGTRIVREGASHGLTPEASIAIFACLSTGTSIDVNWRNYLEVINVGHAQSITYALGWMRTKIDGLYAGTHSIPQVIAGPKVTSFWNNFMGSVEHVTVDRHARSMVYGKPMGKQSFDLWEYDYCAQVIRIAAACLGLTPREAQAIGWCVWQRKHGKRHDNGMSWVSGR